MYLLGIDLGSSSVKVTVLDGESGNCVAAAFYPSEEMPIIALKQGWAEQDPGVWWSNLRSAINDCASQPGADMKKIGAIGISYQMHGLVVTGKDGNVLRPSIIWCDSRAVSYGENAFKKMGSQFCLSHLLNSPGNFTASKLAWVKENEPELYRKAYRIMLPGDYIAMRMTGEISTTYTGLSEGIFWDFTRNGISDEVLDAFGFDRDILPVPGPSFSVQGLLLKSAAEELGLPEGIPVSYRAGDQPNNALSLNVLDPGEVAATAGTSGVIYGVTDQRKFDPQSRVNTFLHVNHSPENMRLGVLLCINGTGILNSWIRRIAGTGLSYGDMNRMASDIPAGSEGVLVLPFGNGAERMLFNKDSGCQIKGLNFNRHGQAHLFRAVQEGIAFSFRYGLDIMKETGIDPVVIRAGEANMFLSRVFRETLAGITETEIHLYLTDGSAGAARGAGIGCGFYRSEKEAFSSLKPSGRVVPDLSAASVYREAYEAWKEFLVSMI